MEGLGGVASKTVRSVGYGNLGVWWCRGCDNFFSGELKGGSDILRFFQLAEDHMSFRNFVNV